MQFKITKTKKVFQKEDLSATPSLFWMMILAMMFVIIVSSFGFGFYLFIKVNADPVLSDEELGGQVETVDRDNLNRALEYFSERQKKSLYVLSAPAPVIDPSL
jgi:hypothetical protein